MPTEDLASLLFGRGVPAADELRMRLFDALGVEPDLLISTDEDDVVVSIVHWVSGPCATSFMVRPTTPETPGLGVLEVMTVLGVVRDLESARANVDLLNLHTTLNRWTIVGDPGPDGWAAAGGGLVDDDDTRAIMSNLVHGNPMPTPHVVCAVSFVVGHAALELPFGAVELTVREQIAKVTALMSSGLPDVWGETFIGHMPDGRTRTGADDWHEVVYHFDARVAPHRDVDATPLMGALVDAFNAHVSEQTSSGGAFWLGSADTSGFTCEVPYGPGPYPGGAVWSANPAGERGGDATATSLVQAFIVPNPQIGNGLLMTMRLPHPPPPEHRTVGWTAALLNEQALLTAPGASTGTAHGVGAWVEQDGQPTYRCFVPAAWLVDPDGPEPRPLLLVLLANLARLSWAARRVLEFDPSVVEAVAHDRHPPGSGLTAGSTARGPVFGEPGLGTDPGARLLASAFQHTVGPDADWAQLTHDRRGFVWWPNAFQQTFEAVPCACEAQAGALVSITTPLGTARPDRLDGLARLGAAGHPFAVCLRPDDVVELRSKLHVHDDTFSWLWSWPTAISVAQAITAEELHDRFDDANRSAPAAAVRPDRDRILEIFDLPSFRTPPPELAGPRALALAPLRIAQVPFAARWDDGAAVVTWATDGSLPRDAAPAGRLASTRIARRTGTAYGPALEVDTRFAVDTDDDTFAWTLRANDALVDRFNGTIVGGFVFDHGPVYCSFVPLGLEHDADSDHDGAFSGALLAHHSAVVVDAMSRFPELRLDPSSQETELDACLATLVDFYRRSFELPSLFHVEVSDEQPGSCVVRIRRGSTVASADRPALTETSPDQLLTELVLEPEHTLAGLHLIHCVLLLGDRPQDEVFDSPPGLGAHRLRRHELWSVVDHLVDAGVLASSDEGALLVPTNGTTQPVSITADRSGGGLVIQCELAGSSVSDLRDDRSGRVRIGTWFDVDGTATYRVTLPALAFVVNDPSIRRSVLALALRAVASEVTRCADQRSPG